MLILALACKPSTALDGSTPVVTDPPPQTPVPATPAPLPDMDGDGIEDDVDNCLHDDNPGQEDLDVDGEGDACDADRDGDLIPEPVDIFPNDPERPGRAINERVYAHTSGDVWTFDVFSLELELVGAPGVGTLTDLAIDRHGVLWVVTFGEIYICHPQTMECWLQGSFNRSVNGLTFLPDPDPDATVDTLVIIANDGSWAEVSSTPGGVSFTPLGGYGSGFTSSGDAFSILGTGTYAAVDGPSGGQVVEVASDGSIVRDVTDITGNIWGLAGWNDVIFAFSSTGTIFEIEPVSGETHVALESGISWYGAGVVTSTPPDI